MSILGDDSNGKFQVGWFRGGQADPPSGGKVAAALAWARSKRGAPYQGTNDLEPRLPGTHRLVARRPCGCIMIHCSNEPDVVALSGSWCVGDSHDNTSRSEVAEQIAAACELDTTYDAAARYHFARIARETGGQHG